MKRQLNKAAGWPGAGSDFDHPFWPDDKEETKEEKIKRFEDEEERLLQELERIRNILDSLRYPEGQDFNDAMDGKYANKSINALIKLADLMDKQGYKEIADEIDEMISLVKKK